MKQTKFILLSLILSLVLLFSCSRNYAEKDFQKNSSLLYTLLNPDQTPEMKLCQALVFRVNTCIAAGFGFETYTMCASQNVAATVDEYQTALVTASAKIKETNCNMPQYKYRDAGSSIAEGAAFETIQTVERTVTDPVTLVDTVSTITLLVVPYQLPEVK